MEAQPVTGGADMGEHAARWFRGSTTVQDEKNQEREVDQHIAQRGYQVADDATFTLHGKSASKGEQEAELAAILAGIPHRWTVVVIAHSSRLDRRDPDVQMLYVLKIRMAGGRIESAREPEFGQSTLSGRVLTLLAQDGNHKYSKDLSEHVAAAVARVRDNGAFWGTIPFGFDVEGEKYNKRLVPNEQGRKLIPEVFDRITKGQSQARVAAWLSGETGNTWHPTSIGRIIRNPVYKGLKCEPIGERYGKLEHTCDHIVDAVTWRKAQTAIDVKPKRGPATKNDAFLKGIIECSSCGGPMYRITCPTKRNGEPVKIQYYRCVGKVQRKSCGVMVPLIKADEVARKLLEENILDHPILEWVTTEGSDHANEIELVNFQLSRLGLEGLTEDEEDAKRAELRAERKRLENLPKTEPTRELVFTDRDYRDDWDGTGAWFGSQGFRVVADKYRVVLVNPQDDRYEVLL
jgi:DNA invertase Pin-like site-specific DNA recombinase